MPGRTKASKAAAAAAEALVSAKEQAGHDKALRSLAMRASKAAQQGSGQNSAAAAAAAAAAAQQQQQKRRLQTVTPLGKKHHVDPCYADVVVRANCAHGTMATALCIEARGRLYLVAAQTCAAPVEILWDYGQARTDDPCDELLEIKCTCAGAARTVTVLGTTYDLDACPGGIIELRVRGSSKGKKRG